MKKETNQLININSISKVAYVISEVTVLTSSSQWECNLEFPLYLSCFSIVGISQIKWLRFFIGDCSGMGD